MPEKEGTALEITSASVSAIGGRSANEDALGEINVRSGRCYVISDGAGGHFGGTTARERRFGGMIP